VEADPLGETTAVVWMLALLFRLEPKPRLLKRELMTSTMGSVANGVRQSQKCGQGDPCCA